MGIGALTCRQECIVAGGQKARVEQLLLPIAIPAHLREWRDLLWLQLEFRGINAISRCAFRQLLKRLFSAWSSGRNVGTSGFATGWPVSTLNSSAYFVRLRNPFSSSYRLS